MISSTVDSRFIPQAKKKLFKILEVGFSTNSSNKSRELKNNNWSSSGFHYSPAKLKSIYSNIDSNVLRAEINIDLVDYKGNLFLPTDEWYYDNPITNEREIFSFDELKNAPKTGEGLSTLAPRDYRNAAGDIFTPLGAGNTNIQGGKVQCPAFRGEYKKVNDTIADLVAKAKI